MIDLKKKKISFMTKPKQKRETDRQNMEYYEILDLLYIYAT